MPINLENKMAKSIHNLGSLKEKILSKKTTITDPNMAEKFKLADKTLGISENKNQQPSSTLRVVKKTFSIPSNELQLIDEVKGKALNKKIVLSESETIRLGILIAKESSEELLVKFAKQLEVLPKGRPKSK